MIESDLTYVYFLYGKRWEMKDDDGGIEEIVLLYVGITNNLLYRLKQHLSEKDWAPSVGSIEWEIHMSRQEALDSEEKHIKQLKPLFNTQHAKMEEVEKERERFKYRSLDFVPGGEGQNKHDIRQRLIDEQQMSVGISKLQNDIDAIFTRAVKDGLSVSRLKLLVENITKQKSEAALEMQERIAK
jgi:hypothetical protein